MPTRRHPSPATARLLAGLWLLACTAPTPAGDFAVAPIRLDLDPATRSAAVTVTNNGRATLDLALTLKAWSQDEAGGDRYEPSDALIYFPRVVSLAPAARQVVRVGLRQPPGAVERSYRLYLEEVTPPARNGGARVSLAIRFGVPVFVAPAAPAPAATLETGQTPSGDLLVHVRNTGNVHLRLEEVVFEGAGLEQRLPGWYLLPGRGRDYRLALSSGQCAELDQVRVTVRSDALTLEDRIPVDRSLCGP
ncbi:fimbrial biogenesis chaperone [Thioalbus denitrificans]|uniref:Fimbrial chaperone protein n=1 Tax=Thioalbus denitrificans TaxID=547122 RepID=A0A369CIZ2_9GAMM|nr:fimbria/pilus periplasmic chaperone [Thioalbus denitrificans]RCX33248.1 fimbrial chaperone protein [Thioalbus denitrificans]